MSFSPPPTLDFEMQDWYQLTLTVTDTGSLSHTSYLNVTIVDVNEPPVILNLPNLTAAATIPEDVIGQLSLYEVISSDPDGDVLTYTLTIIPDGPFSISTMGKIIDNKILWYTQWKLY